MTKVMEPTNKEFANSDRGFKDACEKANIPATRRQASRWRLKKGLAWKFRIHPVN